MDFNEDEAFPPLPPPLSPSQGGLQDGDPLGDGADVSALAEVPAAKRKTVKKPQPKLDSNRLTSKRGLPALRSLFDPVRFKGRGHEVEDLRLLMQKMENWAHRLYPKLKFEDFMERVEKLGAKKDVQTCLKRIRLDMPLIHEDFTDRDGEEEVPSDLQLLDDPEPTGTQDFFHSTPSNAPFTSGPAFSSQPPSLSEEQRRRMEANRQRALERKLARQQQMPPSDSQTVATPDVEPSASSVSSLPDQDEKVEERESDSNRTEQEPELRQSEAAAEDQTDVQSEVQL